MCICIPVEYTHVYIYLFMYIRVYTSIWGREGGREGGKDRARDREGGAIAKQTNVQSMRPTQTHWHSLQTQHDPEARPL